jgi:ParB family chromosome partitioning protein
VLAVLKYVGAPDPQPLPAAGEAIAAAEIKRLAFGTYAGLVRQAPATGEADETHRVRRDSIERLAALAADAEIGREAVLPLFRRALSDPHHLVRKAAMVGLRRLYGPDSLEPLALALESNAADVGRQAVDELCAAAAAGRADAGELARRALAISPNGEVRAHALGRLPRLYPEGSVDPWLLALDCPHPDVRLSVVDRLVDLRDERVTRALGQAMESSHEDLRLKAADALARRGDARTVDVLGTFLRSEDAGIWRRAVEALCALAHARPLDAAQADAAAAAAEVVARRIEDDPDKTADRAALLAALARIASPAADPVLIRLLADEQGAVRNDALRALLAIAKDRKQPAKVYPDGTLRERYDEELALRYLGEAAACTDVALRQLAAQHLADLDDNRAEALLARLTTDRDESVRVAACQRLAFRAERLETATTEPLSAALRTGRRELVLPAAAGLAARRRPEAFQALMLVLKAGEGAEREQAVLGLGSLGDRRALEELEPLVDPRAEVPDEDKVLAPVAAMALGMMIARLDDEEERRRVRETVERLVREGTPAVRQKAIAGLRLAGDDRSRALIERIATDRYEDASIRLTALTELGLLARAESEPALAQVLDDANVQLRKAALEALGRVIPEDRTRVALLALRSRYTDVSQPAASFLALRGDAATLVERLPEIESPEVRRRLRQGLVRRGDRPSDALRRLLEGGRAEARAEAAWVAGASGDAALSESVLAAVERSAAGWREARTRLAGATRGSDDRELNANVEAWRAGLWAAARLGAPAVDQARRALEKDAPPVVQRQALRFLSLHGGTKVQLAELEVCLASPDRGVRMAAAAALAALSPGEGRTVLRVIRELPAVDAAAVAPMVQTALASAGQELLGSDAGRRVALPILIGSRRTAELTAIALASGADPARLVAIAALGRIGGEEADSALGQILTRGDAEDEAVRREAFRALRRLRRAAAKRFVEGKDKEKRGGGWGGGGEDDEGDEDDGGDEEGGGEDDLEDAGDDGDDGDGGDDDGDYDEDDEGDEGDEGDEDDEDDED